ncbi:MAG: FkbM family methyltransferase [Acidobacteria bacterium]|nr:FkbM family methyltransferase [Acidobacteriota bacterium]
MDFNAAVIKRRLVEKLGPAENVPASPAASASTTVDLAPLLAIADDASFVRESYLRILGRECDVGGFVHYRELLRNHFSRRAMILQLVESAEAKSGGRRYVGLWDRSQEGRLVPGARWVAGLKLSVWNRSRRLFEFFLRVSRVESIELKLDYVMQESAIQAERNISKLDHTLFTISDKVDRYVADLVIKQAELTALVRENGVQQASQAQASFLRQGVVAEEGRKHRAAVLEAFAEEGRQQRVAVLGALVEEGSQHRAMIRSLTDATQHNNAQLEQLRRENQALRESIADIRRQQRSPVFQAGPDVIVTEVDGLLLGVPSQEWRLGAYYALRGLPEPGMTRLFASFIQPGMVVVDIGAHIGIYTLFALRQLSGHGRVYSFEPTPKTFALLRDNVQVNGFLESGVARLDHRAISDQAGTANFTAYPANSGHNSLFGGAAPGEALSVETVTLDAALADEPRIDVIKIDAEGSEPFVLRGMTGILGRNPAVRIFVEFAPGHLRRAGIEPLQWYEELAKLGLKVQRVEDVSGALLPVEPDTLADCISWNLLLTR